MFDTVPNLCILNILHSQKLFLLRSILILSSLPPLKFPNPSSADCRAQSILTGDELDNWDLIPVKG
jgi:hypothetical protein